MVLKIIVNLFFIVLGATAGYLYVPDTLSLLGVSADSWFTSPYVGMVLGAIVFFLISYWLADYIVNFLKWIEDALIKLPAVDLMFGSLGLIIGLVIAYFFTIPLQDIRIEIVSQILPLFITILLGYFGFQVGFRRRDEFFNLLKTNKREKRKSIDGQDVEEVTG
jgi:uncharacterized protein YacL